MSSGVNVPGFSSNDSFKSVVDIMDDVADAVSTVL